MGIYKLYKANISYLVADFNHMELNFYTVDTKPYIRVILADNARLYEDIKPEEEYVIQFITNRVLDKQPIAYEISGCKFPTTGALIGTATGLNSVLFDFPIE